jgi:hypothetical protein
MTKTQKRQTVKNSLVRSGDEWLLAPRDTMSDAHAFALLAFIVAVAMVTLYLWVCG